jgi:hypothetical protein
MKRWVCVVVYVYVSLGGPCREDLCRFGLRKKKAWRLVYLFLGTSCCFCLKGWGFALYRASTEGCQTWIGEGRGYKLTSCVVISWITRSWDLMYYHRRSKNLVIQIT